MSGKVPTRFNPETGVAEPINTKPRGGGRMIKAPPSASGTEPAKVYSPSDASLLGLDDTIMALAKGGIASFRESGRVNRAQVDALVQLGEKAMELHRKATAPQLDEAMVIELMGMMRNGVNAMESAINYADSLITQVRDETENEDPIEDDE